MKYLPHWLDPALLVVAHPGHELMVYRWLEQTRALTMVLTDGSGHLGTSRLASTTRVLEAVGAKPGPLYGRFTDAGLYRMILDGDLDRLRDLVLELAEIIRSAGIAYVAADALEGYNPGHDLCRYCVNAAIALVELRDRRTVGNYDVVFAGPLADPADPEEGAICIELDAAALARKHAAISGYPELKQDVEALLQRHGERCFSVENLRPAALDQGIWSMPEDPPHYEHAGEQRVQAGYYEDVLRYRQHMQPLVHALWRRLELPLPEHALQHASRAVKSRDSASAV